MPSVDEAAGADTRDAIAESYPELVLESVADDMVLPNENAS